LHLIYLSGYDRQFALASVPLWLRIYFLKLDREKERERGKEGGKEIG